MSTRPGAATLSREGCDLALQDAQLPAQVLGIVGGPSAGSQITIVLPPVEPDLLSLVDRADDQPDPDREELDFGERDLDISGDGEPLVEHPVEHIDEGTGSMIRRRQIGPHCERAGDSIDGLRRTRKTPRQRVRKTFHT